MTDAFAIFMSTQLSGNYFLTTIYVYKILEKKAF